MISLPENLSVLIGASPRVQPIRRRLLRDGIRQLGVATSLPGLRRELHVGAHDLVIGCLLIDELTMCEHGHALRQLLADAKGFNADFRCVGLVCDDRLLQPAATLGCHSYVQHPAQLAQVIRSLARDWSNRSDKMCHSWRSFSTERLFTTRTSPRRGAIESQNRFNRRFGFGIRDQDDSW